MRLFALSLCLIVVPALAFIGAARMSAEPLNIAEDFPSYSRSGHDIRPLSDERIEELAKDLTQEQRDIILKKGTEPAFCGNLLDNKMDGTYVCTLCSLPLFKSDSKFTSGTGWPSFFQPVDPDHIRYEKDNAFGMQRIEILCKRCRGHLGHVFDDGPKPTGMRYCVNSASLTFHEKSEQLPEAAQPVASETAYFAGGCFWGIEDRFQQIPGVINVVSGYQGGDVKDPSYREVCAGKTGHAEAVRIEYDPKRVSYRELLVWFFRFHDPTQVDRQGPDRGTQYRTAIFAATKDQYDQAEQFLKDAANTERFANTKIATQLQMADTFYDAETYHQDYYEVNGGTCYIMLDTEWDLNEPVIAAEAN